MSGKFLILVVAASVSIRCAGSSQTKVPPRSEPDIEGLVDELGSHPWAGPENMSNPTHWLFNFTDPMHKILEAGPAAQTILLHHIGDAEIKDQIIILLGGVGNGSSIEPIINAMAGKEDIKSDPIARRINLAANLALTNITAAGVIWHRGGGISIDRCPDDPRSCWSDWWKQHKGHLQAETAVDRNYSNYPNYGIYEQRNNH